jgi:hypothetical protein
VTHYAKLGLPAEERAGALFAEIVERSNSADGGSVIEPIVAALEAARADLATALRKIVSLHSDPFAHLDGYVTEAIVGRAMAEVAMAALNEEDPPDMTTEDQALIEGAWQRHFGSVSPGD